MTVIHHMRFLKFKIQRFVRPCERGSVAIIFALTIIPFMVAAGLAVDLSRAYLTKARLSHALDAAGLAVGSMRTTSSDSTYLETQFNAFFTANYPDEAEGYTHDLTFADNGGIITVTGKATIDTAFMSIIGIDTMTVGSSTEITVETNGLELVMVLDNSGSMGSYSKMSDMQDAALDLIDILFGDETAPDLLKVGLVPFDNTVNIGTGNSAYVTDLSAYDWNDGASNQWEGCVMARSYPGDVEDTYSSSSDNWDPFWNKYKTSDRNYKCPRPITALTNNRTTLESEINAMSSLGATHINFGAIWGWRVISPSEPFTEGAAYSDSDWNKAVIILTDGDNTFFNNSSTYYSAYEPDDISESELDDRLLEVCTGMKAKGIVVYTIAFGTGISSSTESLLSSCATDTDNYYESPDSNTLSLAFRAIGAELKNLHLSQ